ncbi:MAG: hypothetical protein IPK67_05935 [Planctomycetes bacterium]|nr:hypothetical protein [Planctomycetota bacterium]
MPQEAKSTGGARAWAALLCAVLAILWGSSVSMSHSLGYDEAMHAEAPALRLLAGVQQGEWGTVGAAFFGCEQYPFGYPLLLALVQACTGPSELACRVTGRVLFALTVFLIFLITERAARGAVDRGALDSTRARFAPWIALGFAALSPLALAYSGTLFLEGPFLAAAAASVHLWLARREALGPRAARLEILTGLLLAAAFFTKFNYAVLLIGGLCLDFLAEGLGALRAKALAPWIASAGRLALLPALSLLWWFVLPWPAGLETAASHRETFVAFLLGNQTLVAPKTFPERAIDWLAGVFANPRAFCLGCLGVLAALRRVGLPQVRSLGFLALALVVPVALHPYHLDRFLLPGALVLWILAGLGLALCLPRAGGRALAVLAGLVVLCGVRRDLDTSWLPRWVVTPQGEEVAAYQRAYMAEKISLHPARVLPTAGLDRATSDAALDLLHGLCDAAGSGDLHLCWLGPVAKLPPMAIQLGLVRRGGDPRRLLDDPARAMLLGVAPADPGWDDGALAAAAAPFDVVLASDPVTAFGTGEWAFVQGHVERLLALGYRRDLAGPLLQRLPMGKERSVHLLVLRKPR